jgi:hypothetical protein
MSGIETVTAAVKDRAHSFKHIRRATGLRLSDQQFLNLIQENQDRLEFTRIRRADAVGKRIRPGWPGVKLKAAATT